MAYKRVRLLNEKENEILYPETDWSIVKNSPVKNTGDGVQIIAKKNVEFLAKNNSNSVVNSEFRVNANKVVFSGKPASGTNLLISNERTANQPIHYRYYPRTEKATKDFPLGDFFGSVVFTSKTSDNYGKIFPAIGIGEGSSGVIDGYAFLYFDGTQFQPVDFDTMDYIPLNRTSGIF